jgi:hypothetical protein
MPLKGNLQAFSLTNVLQLLGSEKKTGILRISNNKEEYQVCFLDGFIVYATESQKGTRLGRLLIEDGIISNGQLQECLAIAQKVKKALGKVFVEQGYISKRILEKYIYKQVIEIISKIFLWEKGDFEYNDAKLNLNWLVVTKLNTMKIIMDALKHKDEMNAILQTDLNFSFPADDTKK